MYCLTDFSTRLRFCAYWILLLGPNLAWQTQSYCQGPQLETPPQSENAPLAWLGEQPIAISDVDFLLGRARSGQLSDTQLGSPVIDAAIFIIAQQRQALQTLRKLNQAAGKDAVDRWIVENGLPTPDAANSAASIARQIAEEFGITTDAYFESIAFRLSWEAYLARHLTEENVEKHFFNQRRRFDGTQFRISMISIAVPVGQSEKRSEAHRRLATLAEKLAPAGENWRDLVEQESETDWILTQGRWVAGNGQLENGIVDALLVRGDDDAWGKPIDTLSGVHLLWLENVRAGQRELAEVRGEVRAHILVYLLEHLAAQSRDQLPLRSRAQASGK